MEEKCWDLDYHLAVYILPHLLYYKNWLNHWGIPQDFLDYPDEWNEVLSEMIWAFSHIVSNKLSHSAKGIDLDHNPFDTVQGAFNITWKEGFDVEEARRKDNADYWRCQNGLNLFAQYYRALWD